MQVVKILIPTLVLVFSLSACSDPCKDINCGAGDCDGGDCRCDAGWSRDADGRCTVQDVCYQKNCGEHGTCNPASGGCDCGPGWITTGNGFCNTPDPCYQKDCGAHGTCNATTGNCDCDFGYELDFNGKCNLEARQIYIGTWRGSHVNDIGQTSGVYDMIVQPVSWDVNTVLVINFMDYYCGVLNKPLEIYASVSPVHGMDFVSLCASYETDGTFDNAYLISPDVLKVNVFLTTSGSGWNLDGTYQRQ